MPENSADDALPAVVSIHVLAQLCGIEQRMAFNLAKNGIFHKTTRGKYLLVPSMQSYTEHLREQAAGRQGRKESDVDVVEEGALLKRAQRLMFEKKAQQLDGTLISIPELMEVWGDIIKAVRQMVLSWPQQVAFELPHLSDHDKAVMSRIANSLLRSNSLSNDKLGPLPEPPKDEK